MVIDKEGRGGLGKERGRWKGEMTRSKEEGKISERLSEVEAEVVSSRCLGFHVSHVCF